jgi:hypothetical protein
MNKENIKKVVAKYDDNDVATVIMEYALENFNEKNFNYYDYSVAIFFKIVTLVKDKIITKERALSIEKEVASMIQLANRFQREGKCNE